VSQRGFRVFVENVRSGCDVPSIVPQIYLEFAHVNLLLKAVRYAISQPPAPWVDPWPVISEVWT
jgi:hypothetical protein